MQEVFDQEYLINSDIQKVAIHFRLLRP